MKSTTCPAALKRKSAPLALPRTKPELRLAPGATLGGCNDSHHTGRTSPALIDVPAGIVHALEKSVVTPRRIPPTSKLATPGLRNSHQAECPLHGGTSPVTLRTSTSLSRGPL